MCTPPKYVNYRQFYGPNLCTMYTVRTVLRHRAEPYIIFEAHNAYFYIRYSSAYRQTVCFFLWTQAGTSAHCTKSVHVRR
jgi:hypothetical protein